MNTNLFQFALAVLACFMSIVKQSFAVAFECFIALIMIRTVDIIMLKDFEEKLNCRKSAAEGIIKRYNMNGKKAEFNVFGASLTVSSDVLVTEEEAKSAHDEIETCDREIRKIDMSRAFVKGCLAIAFGIAIWNFS